MTDIRESRALVVHAVAPASAAADRTVEGFELRTVGIGVVANLLHMPVADFDCVRVAAARSDTLCCPVCRPGQRRAA